MTTKISKGMENMHSLLTVEEWARERKNKYEAVAFLIKQKYPQLREVPDSTLADVVFDACREDRYWRRVTQLFPELRGKDYEKNKEELEEVAREDLGYTITP